MRRGAVKAKAGSKGGGSSAVKAKREVKPAHKAVVKHKPAVHHPAGNSKKPAAQAQPSTNSKKPLKESAASSSSAWVPDDVQETFDDLSLRTKRLVLATIRLAETAPKSVGASVLIRNLVRASGLVAANYRVAEKVSTKREWLQKVGPTEDKVDEVRLWLELLAEPGILGRELISPLMIEANQIASGIASVRTSKDSPKKSRDGR